MINKNLVQGKLADLNAYYQELDLILKNESRDIIEDNLKLRSVERLFQLIVDTAIDINSHLISSLDLSIPDDYQSTFITLAENKLILMDFALKIAPSVGLRNIVVHKYGKVDIKKMIDDVKENIGDYLEYERLIAKIVK